MEIDRKQIIFFIMAFIGFLLFKGLIYLLDKRQINDFLETQYELILNNKPIKDDSNKGLYFYDCTDLKGNKELQGISSRVIYNAVLKGDTIQKIKGDTSIIIKRKHLVLKFTFDGIYTGNEDTILVR
ncbi:hypothetical protein VB264_20070 [Arcicella aquatica]|uniref:Uncharacterized protein n=1 Tax=Arcicella aquatica TaxID=217141 RepID=A0ABU5QTC8_9BACT|nr:hypothetical protein [Arcicella aquatica]MEA5260105.1 hypothetical protein [Arcicella aquatica]